MLSQRCKTLGKDEAMALRGLTPRVFKLSLRSQPERGGPVRATVEGGNALEKDTEWRHLLVLVHGYNNKESEAEGKYDRYVGILRPGLEKSRVAPDVVAKFHWPGNAAVGPFSAFDFAGYHVDVKRALQSVDPLAAFLSRLIATGPAGRLISFVGHSLGCRLITEAMCRIGTAGRATPPLAVVSLMAAAVPVALAETGGPLAGAPAAAAKVLKAYSRNDWVLWLAFPAGQSLAWAAGIEQAAYGEAIGRNGNPEGFGEPLPREDNGHGDYWTDEFAAAMLLATMDATLRELPPSAKIPAHGLPPADEVLTRGLISRKLPT
jgi:hypothetical protein